MVVYPGPPPSVDFVPPHLTSSFAAVIINMAARGRRRTRNLNNGRNKLLSQSTHCTRFATFILRIDFYVLT